MIDESNELKIIVPFPVLINRFYNLIDYKNFFSQCFRAFYLNYNFWTCISLGSDRILFANLHSNNLRPRTRYWENGYQLLRSELVSLCNILIYCPDLCTFRCFKCLSFISSLQPIRYYISCHFPEMCCYFAYDTLTLEISR